VIGFAGPPGDEAKQPTICGCLGADVAARPETDPPVLPDPGTAFLPVLMSAKD
jgi:hypothetical protein